MSEQAGIVKAMVPPALVDMSMVGLFEELMKRLDIRFGGDYRKRFLEIAKERHSLATKHQCILSTAVGLHLLIEALDTKEPPKLRGARLVAEEVMRLVVTRNGNLFGKLDMEGMREFIGSELDLTDEALIEAWETIKSSREKEN
ncbi:MAG: hypothetical protein WA130_04195 [Candidatus Methanoperedens sp.]